MDSTEINVANLEQLTVVLDNESKAFNMGDYDSTYKGWPETVNPSVEEMYVERFKSCACALGWAAVTVRSLAELGCSSYDGYYEEFTFTAGIELDPHLDTIISDQTNLVWDWLFTGNWAMSDHRSAADAARRIRFFLTFDNLKCFYEAMYGYGNGCMWERMEYIESERKV